MHLLRVIRQLPTDSPMQNTTTTAIHARAATIASEAMAKLVKAYPSIDPVDLQCILVSKAMVWHLEGK